MLHCFDEDDSDEDDSEKAKYYFMKPLLTPSIRKKGPKTQNSWPEEKITPQSTLSGAGKIFNVIR